MNDTMTRTVEVHARRWFQRTYGNTYHSVRVVVDGRTVGTRSGVYGYGRHYMHTAGEVLRDADHALYAGAETPYEWAYPFRWDDGDQTATIAGETWRLVETCEDVARKRDLLPSWWGETP